MIKLIVEAKEPVYAELGAEPTGYQVMFGPDRDADNSAWVPQGARPAASASVIMNPEAAASYNVGDAVYLPGKDEVVDLDGDVGPLGDRAELENADDSGEDARTPAGAAGTLSESGSDVTPVAPEPDAPAATAKTRKA